MQISTCGFDCQIKKPRFLSELFVGGPYRIRTDDLLIANEALYQLS